MSADTPLLVSVNAAAKKLGICRSTVLDLPELEHIYIGKRHMISMPSIERVAKSGAGKRSKPPVAKSPGRPRKSSQELAQPGARSQSSI
jgi:hypothetical protein